MKLTQLNTKVLKILTKKAQKVIADFPCENPKSQVLTGRERIDIRVGRQRLESAFERTGLFYYLFIRLFIYFS